MDREKFFVRFSKIKNNRLLNRTQMVRFNLTHSNFVLDRRCVPPQPTQGHQGRDQRVRQNPFQKAIRLPFRSKEILRRRKN